jgi:two-component system response regulator
MIIKPDQLILLVEDSPEDYQATVRSLKKAGLANPIFRCEDGDQALDYLFRRGEFGPPFDATRPGLILLDLNLPGTDGRAVLAEIRRDPELATTPVIVLAVSDDERDIEECYRAGANSYLKKPVDLEGYIQAIQRLANYWFEIVVMPKPGEGVKPA